MDTLFLTFLFIPRYVFRPKIRSFTPSSFDLSQKLTETKNDRSFVSIFRPIIRNIYWFLNDEMIVQYFESNKSSWETKESLGKN